MDSILLQRVRTLLGDREEVSERRMVGGRGFNLRGTLCCGVNRSGLVVRVTPKVRDEVLGRPHVTPMMMGSKATKGFVVVAPEGCASDDALAAWVEHAIENAAEIAGIKRE